MKELVDLTALIRHMSEVTVVSMATKKRMHWLKKVLESLELYLCMCVCLT